MSSINRTNLTAGEQAASGMILQLANGRIQACSKAAEEILGLSRQDIQAQLWHSERWQFLTDSGATIHPARIALETGQANQQIGAYQKQGETVWMSIDAQPLFGDDETAPNAVVITLNVLSEVEPPCLETVSSVQGSIQQVAAQLKTLEQDINTQEQQLRLALESAGMIAFVWDISNDRVTQLYTPDSISARRIGTGVQTLQDKLNLIHPDDRSRFEQHLDVALRVTGQFDIEYRHRLPNGAISWVLDVGRVIYDDDRHPIKLVGIATDITQRKAIEDQLRYREAKLRSLINSNLVGIVLTDFKGNLYEVNTEYLRIIGYTRQEVLETPINWRDITPIEYLKFDDAAINRARNGQPITPYQKEYIRKDGSRISVLVCFSIVEHTDEGLVAAFVLDLSERKHLEAQFRQLADVMPQIVWVCNPNGDLTYVNQRWIEYTGLTLEQAQNRDVMNHLIHPDDLDRVYAEWSQAKQTEQPFQAEYRLRGASDGAYRWFLSRSMPIYDATGRVIEWYGTATDIDEQKATEDTLRQALKKLDLHIENTPLGVIEWNRDLRVMRWSKEAEKIFGWRADEVIGHRWGEWGNFVHCDDEAIVDDAVRRILSGKYPQQVTCNRNYTKDGRMIYSEWHDSVIVDHSGRLESVLSLVLDVTDRVELEQERDRILKQEQTARAQAETANRLKDEFLAVLSHELRTPMNPILGWARMMMTQSMSPQQMQTAIATIDRNARLQIQLIEDLLDVSRILQGKLTLNTHCVDLATVIRNAIETVQLAADAKHIAINVEILTDSSCISGDAGRLQQVVWNLLSNAVKFTPEGGRVTVKLEALRAKRNSVGTDSIRLHVIDTGKGIAADFLPYVFDYFRQEDGSTTRRFGGLGLGLAIVRHIVEMHGGSVAVDSAGENQGTTFTIDFPGLPQLTPSADPIAAPEFSEDVPLSGLRLLVVEDEEDSRDFIQVVLEMAGAQVMVAANAQTALPMLDAHEFDVLISDIGMPDLDGYEFLQAVRSLNSGQIRIPAIALTAYAGDANQQAALQAGFAVHLAKPVDPDELIRTIAQLRSQSV